MIEPSEDTLFLIADGARGENDCLRVLADRFPLYLSTEVPFSEELVDTLRGENAGEEWANLENDGGVLTEHNGTLYSVQWRDGDLFAIHPDAEYVERFDTYLRFADLDDLIPEWIDRDSIPDTIEDLEGWLRDLEYGGCASDQYMPAVPYGDAVRTMGEHGDDVLQYIEDHVGELPPVPQGESWSGIAVHFLSTAVETWGRAMMSELEIESR